MISERDVFVRAQRHLLLQNLFLPWRRRGATLLQVGLRSGLHPDFFWEAGFEVSALDSDFELLNRARAASSPKVDFSLGQPDHLPFDDSSCDYVVLAHLGLSEREILAEAVRVASRGVIILEWNRFSLASFSIKTSLPLVLPWDISWLARQECPACHMKFMSILPLPPLTWPGRKRRLEAPKKSKAGRGLHLYRIHDYISPVPIGALLGLRIELEPVVLTPLGAVTEAIRAASQSGKAVPAGGTSSSRAVRRGSSPASIPQKD